MRISGGFGKVVGVSGVVVGGSVGGGLVGFGRVALGDGGSWETLGRV